MNFSEWLATQRGRTDLVGVFALHVQDKKPFSKHINPKLSTVLSSVPVDQRDAAKQAHREYRQSLIRKQAVA